MTEMSRRNFLLTVAAGAAIPTLVTAPRIALAADFSFKIGHDLAESHPLHQRILEAAKRIKDETGGRFDLQVFANSQLGGDTDMLGQVRSGAIEMAFMPDMVLGTLVPLASITGVGFAFGSYPEVWKAMDGDLGATIRKSINKTGLQVMDRIWDNGFRQTTSNVKPIKTPEDMHGFKIRVPSAPLWISMFKALGASPTAMNSSELYSALQTKVVEGQENPLSNIFTQKTYEVQKYCSLTNHMWSGYWVLMNGRAWKGVPADIQQIVARHINQAAIDQRSDVEKLNVALEKTLSEKGLTFNRPQLKPFQEALAKAGFYADWRKKFGDEAWSVLAKYANGLA
ncbi:TRAP transporter substrate-binding protein [Noviherbaspirillum pedocola]|uniref:TRAP transporter substrate-binding protein n=1 Tax=Noviherbaspirillum pedocola TaxID=2801341 RepID=A0A934W8Z7_9BURK|nr:TRAP transporter substrate-binding protein [Noviherbaspirillum pedocola]MBK4739257.1 TRAP transporter substrate-binding protein [Noviherbaspirillum pedocola]